jgi:hypothetical protein
LNYLTTLALAAAVTALAVTGTANAQISYVSASRSVAAGGTCGTGSFSTVDFSDFDRNPAFFCGSNIGQAGHTSSFRPGRIRLSHFASAGGFTAYGDSNFQVTFDITEPVLYSLTASDGGFSGWTTTGQFSGPGTSINFGLGGVTSAQGVLMPGRYEVTSAVMSPVGRPTVILDLVVSEIPFTIDWSTLDNGGGTVAGGIYTLNGTIGQYDAGGLLAGGSFAINSGYWSAFEVFCPADFNRDGSVDFFDYLDFVQAFDSEDPTADFNGDNTVDFFDYLDFVAAFDTEC